MKTKSPNKSPPVHLRTVYEPVEHPHPKYSLAELRRGFDRLGIRAAFEPYSVYDEPYDKGDGPLAEWIDPTTGISCRVWAEYEYWEDDPESAPNRENPDRPARWKEWGGGWYWDLMPQHDNVYGHQLHLESAIEAVLTAAWKENGWKVSQSPGVVSRTLFEWMCSHQGDPRVRELALSVTPYVEAGAS